MVVVTSPDMVSNRASTVLSPARHGVVLNKTQYHTDQLCNSILQQLLIVIEFFFPILEHFCPFCIQIAQMGSHFAQMGSHFAQYTTSNPWSLLSCHTLCHTPFQDISRHWNLIQPTFKPDLFIVPSYNDISQSQSSFKFLCKACGQVRLCQSSGHFRPRTRKDKKLWKGKSTQGDVWGWMKVHRQRQT